MDVREETVIAGDADESLDYGELVSAYRELSILVVAAIEGEAEKAAAQQRIALADIKVAAEPDGLTAADIVPSCKDALYEHIDALQSIDLKLYNELRAKWRDFFTPLTDQTSNDEAIDTFDNFERCFKAHFYENKRAHFSFPDQDTLLPIERAIAGVFFDVIATLASRGYTNRVASNEKDRESYIHTFSCPYKTYSHTQMGLFSQFTGCFPETEQHLQNVSKKV